MKMTEINTLDSLAQHSLRQHIDMVELLRPLQRQLKTPSLDTVSHFNVIFSALRQEIQTTDRYLLKQLKMTAIPDSIRLILVQRQSLQKEILHMIRHTVPGANRVKSLMASEVRSVKNGRKALTGYKTQSDRQGRIVNRTS